MNAEEEQEVVTDYERAWTEKRHRERHARSLAHTAAYRCSEREQQQHAERSRRFRASPKGRTAQAKRDARRRHNIPSDNYARLVGEIRLGHLLCYACGVVAEQIDHVLPVALARLFGLEHLVDYFVAPICLSCHRCKTALDIADYNRLRKSE